VDRNHNAYACNATKHSVVRVTQKGEVFAYCKGSRWSADHAQLWLIRREG